MSILHFYEEHPNQGGDALVLHTLRSRDVEDIVGVKLYNMGSWGIQ